MSNTIRLIIAQVVKLNEKYETIKKLNGENFNIFSILDMERNEVETHSKFISELLNPNGSHAQGDLFLKLFMKNVLNLSTDDMVGAKVQREDITGFITRDKRIDFTIKTSKYQIGIEMKIDADDQDEQLKDYHIELSNRKNSIQEVKLFYLTLTGYEAQPYSSKDLEVDKDYFLISFESEILHWIERCIEKSATIPTLREGLIQYRNLVRKITNTPTTQMEQDMQDIIRDSKEIQAMNTIVEMYPKIWAKKEMNFWDELWNSLDCVEKNGYELIDNLEIWFDENDNEYAEADVIEDIRERRNKKNYSVGFSLDKEFQNKSIRVKIIDWGEGILFGINFFSKNGEGLINQELIEICNNIGLNKKNQTMKYKFLNYRVCFYGRYQTNPTCELFDKKFEKKVKDAQNEIVDLLISLKAQEKKILKAY